MSGQSSECFGCPLIHIEQFLGKNIENCKFRTISKIKIKNFSRTKQIRLINLASFSSNGNDFVVRDNLPRINNSRYAFSILNKVFKTGKTSSFRTPRTFQCNKKSELKYLFVYDFRQSISSMGSNFFVKNFRSPKIHELKKLQQA